MLILTRRKNEQIMIGEQIRLTVVAIRGNQVRLGVEAPRHIAVSRQESPHEQPPGAPRGHQLPLPFPED